MNDIAVEVNHVWKKFHKGEFDNCLRDFVPAFFRNHNGQSNGSKLEEKDFWALRDLNFDVRRGEVFGIIGPNGAGKSTILKVLSGILRPNIGKVRVNGRLTGLIEVGAGFHQDLTGRENIYLNGAILGMRNREIDKIFDVIVDFSGLEDFIDTPVKRYSSGMYARLGFAVAAHVAPEILLVDEVLAVGDAAFRKKCLGKMSDVARNGRTVLFVSHNIEAVQSFTSRCVYLQDGQAKALGSTREVVEEYFDSLGNGTLCDFRSQKRLSPTLGRKVRISHINPQQPNKSGFRFCDDLVFEVEMDCKVELRGLRLAATIVDIECRPVLTTFTPSVIDTPPSGRRIFKLVISDTRLAPGTYRLCLSIGDFGEPSVGLNYDIVNPGPLFTIAPTGSNNCSVFQWNKAYGAIVHSQSEVTLSQANSA